MAELERGATAIRNIESQIAALRETITSQNTSDHNETHVSLRRHSATLMFLYRKQLTRLQGEPFAQALFTETLAKLLELYDDMGEMDLPENFNTWVERRRRVEANFRPRLIWRTEIELPYTLYDANLKLEDRETAFKELLLVHRDNFNKRKHDGAGVNQYLHPLIDDPVGIGKTYFAKHYISMFREARQRQIGGDWKLQTPLAGQFGEELSQARTIVMKLEPGCLANLSACDRKRNMRHAFISTISRMIGDQRMQGSTYFIESSSMESTSTVSCLQRVVDAFIQETNTPLFLVLDEICRAFAIPSLSMQQQRDQFDIFCYETLEPLLSTGKLYMLLTGHAMFLSHVADRTPENELWRASQSELRRITLNLLREEYIGNVLKYTTRFKDDGPVSLEFNYKLDDDTKKRIATGALIDKTNGDPRHMMSVLERSQSLRALEDCGTTLSEVSSHIHEWVASLMVYTQPIRLLLQAAEYAAILEGGESLKSKLDDSCRLMDAYKRAELDADTDEDLEVARQGIKHATKVVSDARKEWIAFEKSKKFKAPAIELTERVFGEGSLQFWQLADRALFRREGTRVFVSTIVKQHLSAIFLPFRQFITAYQPNTPLQFNHATNFELCCMRRLQEMCMQKSPKSLAQRFPKWFSNSTFGGLRGIQLAEKFMWIPKITSTGSFEYIGLDQETAHPKTWPLVRAAMLSLDQPRCFVPREKSSSSDIIFTTSIMRDGQDIMVTVGVAAKCYANKLGVKLINDERRKFNIMFMSQSELDTDFDEKPVACKRAKLVLPSLPPNSQMNILIICSSGGFVDAKDQVLFRDANVRLLKPRKTMTEFAYVHETLLLDMSTAETRADFFGVSDRPELSGKVENIVGKCMGSLSSTSAESD